MQDKTFADEDNFDSEDLDEYEEFPNDEFERKEDELADRATASQSFRELRNEIQTLEELTSVADKVCKSGDDKKWRELSRLLQATKKFQNPTADLRS